MQTQLNLLHHCLHLLDAPRPQSDRLVQAALVRLALAGCVCVIDAGNRFDAYALARRVRRQTGALDAILSRIQVARAFTVYQLLTLLEAETAAAPAACTPTLVLDLLALFADESVPFGERSRLLEVCLAHLQRLADRAPVLVTIPAGAAAALGDFPARLAAAAPTVWRFIPPAPPAPAAYQPPLFPH